MCEGFLRNPVNPRSPNERVERPQDHADEQQTPDSRSGEGAGSALERLRELERRQGEHRPPPTGGRQDCLTPG